MGAGTVSDHRLGLSTFVWDTRGGPREVTLGSEYWSFGGLEVGEEGDIAGLKNSPWDLTQHTGFGSASFLFALLGHCLTVC